MKRSIGSTTGFAAMAALAVMVTLVPSKAHADFVGVFGHGQVGYAKTPQFSDIGYGVAAGVELIGIQAFADLRLFRNESSWAELGLGFEIGLPVPLVDIYVRPNVGFVHIRHTEEQRRELGLDSTKYWALDGGLMAGIDYELFSLVYLGAQASTGYLLFTNDWDAEQYFSGMGVLRIKI